MKPTKVQNIGIYLLSRYGKEAGTIELNKLFYLTDITFFRLFGKTLSELEYKRAEKGPYSRKIVGELCPLIGHEIARNVKPSRGFSPFLKAAWSMGPDHRFGCDLAEVEKEVITQVVSIVKDLTPFEIEKLAYRTEPMVAILEEEKKQGCPLLDTPVRFNKVKRDTVMAEFLQHQTTPLPEDDKEYLGFLETEWAEFDKVLQS